MSTTSTCRQLIEEDVVVMGVTAASDVAVAEGTNVTGSRQVASTPEALTGMVVKLGVDGPANVVVESTAMAWFVAVVAVLRTGIDARVFWVSGGLPPGAGQTGLEAAPVGADVGSGCGPLVVGFGLFDCEVFERIDEFAEASCVVEPGPAGSGSPLRRPLASGAVRP